MLLFHKEKVSTQITLIAVDNLILGESPQYLKFFENQPLIGQQKIHH